MAITKLGDFEVKIYQPSSQQYKPGIVGPVELDCTEENFLEMLKEHEYEVRNVKRMVIGQGESARVTKTMIIWFRSTSFPEKLFIMFEKFKVTPFISKPFQCYQCQKYGHMY